MNNDYGFIIARHVNSSKTNKYWNHCVKLLRTFYPDKKIVIVDDNSNYEYIKEEHNYKNVEVIRSEFPRRGELLPYYYFLKYKFFKNAVIIHDSVFFHKRVAFEKLSNVDVMPLWFFNSDTENVQNTQRIVRHLKNNESIYKKISKETNILGLGFGKWYGCFGVQCYINLNFLERIERKYNITNLIFAVTCRADRCCLERIFGAIFFTECPNLIHQKSLFGNIMTYCEWGYSYDEYMDNFNKKNVQKFIVKIWTGR